MWYAMIRCGVPAQHVLWLPPMVSRATYCRRSPFLAGDWGTLHHHQDWTQEIRHCVYQQWIAHIFNRLDLFQIIARLLDYCSSMKSLHTKSASKRADCQCERHGGCGLRCEFLNSCLSHGYTLVLRCRRWRARSPVLSQLFTRARVLRTGWSHPILPSTPSQWGSHSPAIHPNWVLLSSFKLSFLSRQMGYVLNVVSLKNKLSLVKKNKFEICRVLLPPSGWLFFGVKREGVNLLHSSESMVSIVSSVNSIDTVDSVRSVYMAVLPPCLMVFSFI